MPEALPFLQLSTVWVLVDSLDHIQAIGNISELEESVGLTWTDIGRSALGSLFLIVLSKAPKRSIVIFASCLPASAFTKLHSVEIEWEP